MNRRICTSRLRLSADGWYWTRIEGYENGLCFLAQTARIDVCGHQRESVGPTE